MTSNEIAHEPLISEEVFEAAQAQLAHRARHGALHKPHRTRRPYVFKSLVYCAKCQRRMQGQHSHDVAYYRCRYPAEYALANRVDHPKNVIMREDAIVVPIDRWVAKTFSEEQRDRTIDTLASQLVEGTVPPIVKAVDYEAKLERYRAALDAGADPAVVAKWIEETQRERDQSQRQRSIQPKVMTADDIRQIVAELGDIAAALHEAVPDDKAKLYRSLRLKLTYEPETQTVRAEIDLGEHRWNLDRVRGGT